MTGKPTPGGDQGMQGLVRQKRHRLARAGNLDQGVQDGNGDERQHQAAHLLELKPSVLQEVRDLRRAQREDDPRHEHEDRNMDVADRLDCHAADRRVEVREIPQPEILPDVVENDGQCGHRAGDVQIAAP